MSEYVLEMLNISKEFPGVKALKNIDFRLRKGSVHGLMGENGAGKSTLMKCLIGMYKANKGKIILKGNEVHFNNTISALNSGISMIHQELSPVPARTVAENVWIGRTPQTLCGLKVNHKKMYQDTENLFKTLNMDIDPFEIMGNLSVAKMQMVEIAKAVSYNADIVIMDEPTSALTETETKHLFKIIENLKEKNVSVIYISHKMDEIFQICDEITVFRDGDLIATDLAENLNIDKLITMMVGRDVSEIFPKLETTIGEVVLKVVNLSSSNAVKNVSFELHKGEILGFAGLVGAGRTEIVETIFGMREKTGGKIYKDGKEIFIKSPKDAIKNKIALLTEDRRQSGIVSVLSVKENLVLANLSKYVGAFRNLNFSKIRKDTDDYVKKLNVKTASVDTQIQNLSGGNQQKVLVARWLLTNPDILIVDEPTRGIDVGAKSEIHMLITKLAKEGKAVILISSEMPEVLGMSDRILVMHEGVMTGILDRKDATSELIMKYATEDKEVNKYE